MKAHWAQRVICCTLLALSLAGRAALAAGPDEQKQGTPQSFTFQSPALGRSMPYEILLPSDYANSQERYPVLYLLHGWHGDETNYSSLTKLASEAAAYKLIVVMPRGENSWYVNSATVPTDRYADYIFRDLIAEVNARFRTIALPQARAIAGISMGGYGALLLSLQHPGAFAFAGSLSGALDGPTGIEAAMPALKASTDAAFGSQGSETRRSSNLRTLLAAASPATQPSFFLACGAADPLLESNRSVVRLLSARGFAYEYHELPGGHTWTFWSLELAPMLESLSRAMHIGRASSLPSSALTMSLIP